jgi:hypothetical protein
VHAGESDPIGPERRDRDPAGQMAEDPGGVSGLTTVLQDAA